MSGSVYKVIELIGTSAESWEKAASTAVERATQYSIMAREVETNQAIYQSLLERAKEIESMAGVSASNRCSSSTVANPSAPSVVETIGRP